MPSNFFLCVCIKCGKSAKKHTKNAELKLLTTENIFGLIEGIQKQLDYDNWAQMFDKCDPRKTKIQTRINT